VKKPKTLGQIAYEAAYDADHYSTWAMAIPTIQKGYERIARAVEREVLRRIKRNHKCPRCGMEFASSKDRKSHLDFNCPR
jgi:hypothetical protein